MKKYEPWQPPRFGEKLPNEVTVYTVAIGNVPILPNKKVKEFFRWVESLDGFVGIRPEYPRGTLLLFETENDAKGARNLIRAKGENVGNNICECFIDKKYVDAARERRNK